MSTPSRFGWAADLLLALGSPLHAKNGITDQEVLVGQTAVLEGSASALGLGMRAGLEAAFKEANAAGGVHGRTVRLVTWDDGYEPDRAIANARALIDTDKVFLLIGGMGRSGKTQRTTARTDAGAGRNGRPHPDTQTAGTSDRRRLAWCAVQASRG